MISTRRPALPAVYVGNSACGSNNWSFDDEGPTTDVRVGSFDLARIIHEAM